MKRLFLASLALAGLSLPTLAMDHQTRSDEGYPTGRIAHNLGTPVNSSVEQNSVDTFESEITMGAVRRVQQALNRQGFYAGRVDGVWGHNTIAAIKAFQRQKKLRVNGRLDSETVASLGLVKGETVGSGAN
jgi:hypothetical protein